MKRTTFYKVSLSASALGVGVAIALWSCWRLLNVFDTNWWTWLYPASLMLMAADGASRGADIVIACARRAKHVDTKVVRDANSEAVSVVVAVGAFLPCYLKRSHDCEFLETGEFGISQGD